LWTSLAEIWDMEPAMFEIVAIVALTRFEAHNTAEFTMLPQGAATNVTRVTQGPASLMSRLMQVFVNLGRMIGKYFEIKYFEIKDFKIGLANLKRPTEN
jgi:hypothetical protein